MYPNAISNFTRPRDTFNHATVFTNRTLINGEMFSIRLENIDNVKWSGGITLGVTTVSPLEINFIEWMPSCTQGKTCLYMDNTILEQEAKVETKTDIDRLQVCFNLNLSINI